MPRIALSAVQINALRKAVVEFDRANAVNLRVHGVALAHGAPMGRGKGEVFPCVATIKSLRAAGMIEALPSGPGVCEVRPTDEARALLAELADSGATGARNSPPRFAAAGLGR